MKTITYLNNEAFTGIVIGLSLTTPLEFNLVPLEVLLVLHNFHETLKHDLDSIN